MIKKLSLGTIYDDITIKFNVERWLLIRPLVDNEWILVKSKYENSVKGICLRMEGKEYNTILSGNMIFYSDRDDDNDFEELTSLMNSLNNFNVCYIGESWKSIKYRDFKIYQELLEKLDSIK